jgi:hypothetical protein
MSIGNDIYRNNMGKRIEEGVAILVKSSILAPSTANDEASGVKSSERTLHVSGVRALFLPRNFTDKRSIMFTCISIMN